VDAQREPTQRLPKLKRRVLDTMQLCGAGPPPRAPVAEAMEETRVTQETEFGTKWALIFSGVVRLLMEQVNTH
jgi:hypothetical protein